MKKNTQNPGGIQVGLSPNFSTCESWKTINSVLGCLYNCRQPGFTCGGEHCTIHKVVIIKMPIATLLQKTPEWWQLCWGTSTNQLEWFSSPSGAGLLWSRWILVVHSRPDHTKVLWAASGIAHNHCCIAAGVRNVSFSPSQLPLLKLTFRTVIV